ncbi:recombinase family protein [Streptomyces sp. NPDC048219]|uniref:recombinase family protein n=1 Tax=unclassified Streptomyces TaxID=2593676 RepID=UPI003420C15D
MASTQQDSQPAVPVRAVLYVCCERSLLRPALGAERAEEEGRAFAAERDITILETVTDPYGQPDPARRSGWQRVRELAHLGDIGMVIVRWPPSIAPEMPHDLRRRETSKLKEHGVDVRYSWAPPVAAGRPR